MRQRQLMRQTTAVDSSWQQGQEEGEEGLSSAWLCGGSVAPPIQEMRSAVVWAGAVEWPCGMCVRFGGVDAVCLLWDWLSTSGGLPVVS